MVFRLLRSALVLITFLFWLSPNANAQDETSIKHTLVTMRLIGHEILLNSGDSTSRILPVTANNGRYKIAFENEFSIKPENLVPLVVNTMKQKNIANHYLVELEQCITHDVFYSFEIGNTDTSTVVSCNARSLPKDCYSLYITIFDPQSPMDILAAAAATNSGIGKTPKIALASNWPFVATILLIVIFSLIYYYFKKRRPAIIQDPDTIAIGEYRFDKRNMELSFHDSKTELTGKEAELLTLLFASANNTVEHETILKAVWDDNGDYVGRTLDVFISKLRKKLDADRNIKIVNVRGVGYRLVLNQS